MKIVPHKLTYDEYNTATGKPEHAYDQSAPGHSLRTPTPEWNAWQKTHGHHQDHVERAIRAGEKVEAHVINSMPAGSAARLRSLQTEVDTVARGDYSNALLHGTTSDAAAGIARSGVEPRVGAFSSEFYGGDGSLRKRAFFAHGKNPHGAVNAMAFHVGHKLGKHQSDLTDDDVRAHGAISVHLKSDADMAGVRRHGVGGRRGLPLGVEPGDYTSAHPVPAHRIIRGDELVALHRSWREKPRSQESVADILLGAKLYEGLPDVEYWTDVHGYHHGQTDATIYATPVGQLRSPENAIGRLPYTDYQGNAHVNHIWTHPDHLRKGIASGMFDHLLQDHQYHEIKWGMTTPDGTQLKKAMDAKHGGYIRAARIQRGLERSKRREAGAYGRYLGGR